MSPSDLSGSLDSGRPSGRVAAPGSALGPTGSGVGPVGSHGVGPGGSHLGPGGSHAPGASSSHGGRPTSSRAGLAGRTFGAYTIQRELGRGANGVVFLATRPGSDAPVAIKVLKDDLAQDQETLQRFRLEAAVAFKLDHPGVVRTLDAGLTGGHHYIAMEYCPGETLAQRLARGPFLPEEARRLVLELARTLAHAHAMGVIHRDVKPGNVIIDPESGRPRLTDFGLSRDRSLARSLTRSGDVLGTPAYMSPEQFRAQKDVDARVDVYGLGAILFECLTGRRPFPATTVAELAAQVLEEPLTSPRALAPQVPAALEVICLKALARERDERYRDGGELARALEAAGPELESRASMVAARAAAIGRAPARRTTSTRLLEGARRQRVPLLVAAGLLLAGVAVGGAIALSGRPARAAREALNAARSQVDGTGDPAAASEAVARAEAAAQAAGMPQLVAEAGALRADLERIGRAEELLSALPTASLPAALEALTTELRARSLSPKDRWARAAGLVDARRGLLQAAALNDRRRPPEDVRAVLDPLTPTAQADPRLRPHLEREVARLRAWEALLDARRRWRTEWRGSSVVPQALANAQQLAAGVDPALADEARLDQARFLLQRGRLEEAEQCATPLMERPGRTGGEAAWIVGSSLAWQGWWMEALSAMDRALKIGGEDSVPGLKALALVRGLPGQGAAGEGFARRALELDPDDVDAQVLLAQCRGYAGDMQGALAELDRLALAWPAETRVPVARMLLMEQANDAAGSDAAAQEAMRRASDDPKFVWLLRGLTRVMPKPGQMRRGGGMGMEMMEGMRTGMEDFERFQELAPRDVRPRLFKAGMDVFLSRSPESLDALRKVNAEDPQLTERFIQNLPDERMAMGLRFMLRSGGGPR